MDQIAGVDEAGRGPLAGPVLAAAVILCPVDRIAGLADSKQLTAKQREHLFTQIIERCVAYGIGRAEVEEIDLYNIHYASLLAMQRAISALSVQPDKVWVDGCFTPNIPLPVQAIPYGDQLIPAISAASILAKVTRDREMVAYDKIYPGYGFAQHKGYATAFHCAVLQELGVSPIHRRNFVGSRKKTKK